MFAAEKEQLSLDWKDYQWLKVQYLIGILANENRHV